MQKIDIELGLSEGFKAQSSYEKPAYLDVIMSFQTAFEEMENTLSPAFWDSIFTSYWAEYERIILSEISSIKRGQQQDIFDLPEAQQIRRVKWLQERERRVNVLFGMKNIVEKLKLAFINQQIHEFEQQKIRQKDWRNKWLKAYNEVVKNYATFYNLYHTASNEIEILLKDSIQNLETIQRLRIENQQLKNQLATCNP